MAGPTNYIPDPMPDDYETGDASATQAALNSGSGGGTLTVEEIDGSPSATNINKILFSNGSVTDDGNRQVTVTTGVGGALTSLSGAGSPEGVVAGSPGYTYFDTAADAFYAKRTGTGTNTGWVALIV